MRHEVDVREAGRHSNAAAHVGDAPPVALAKAEHAGASEADLVEVCRHDDGSAHIDKALPKLPPAVGADDRGAQRGHAFTKGIELAARREREGTAVAKELEVAGLAGFLAHGEHAVRGGVEGRRNARERLAQRTAPTVAEPHLR